MGFEVVVRPVVLPNIRPPAARRIAPPDDPTKGLAVFSSGGGTLVGTSISWSRSTSKTPPHKEVKRQVDTDRVYQKNDDGTINRDNYVEVERMKKIRLDSSQGADPMKLQYQDLPQPKNVETIDVNKTITPD